MTEMSYRPLGSSGLMVSVVGVGCNAFGTRIDGDRVAAIVDAALEEGITLFDTADVYGTGASEELLGRALRGRRDDVVVATKFGSDMGATNGADWGARGSRRYIRRAVEASLRRLGTDWIDLYQLHVPDPGTPIEETLSALDDLVTAGKVRYLGHSNFAGWQLAEAEFVARELGTERFVSSQIEYSLLKRGAEREQIPAAEHFGVGVLPFFPLASGLLTGKYAAGRVPEGSRLSRRPAILEGADWDQLERFSAFARERDLTEVQVAFSWLASRPTVGSVIAGATTPEQVRANAAAVGWVPTEDDEAELDAIFPAPA